MTTGARKAGEFCWINIVTPRPDDARAFFAALLGWTYSEMPGVGHGIKVGGNNIGGIYDLHGPNVPSGARTELGVMVKVASADAVTELANTLGGKAPPAFNVMGSMRMGMCTDPAGARFDLFEAKQRGGTEVDTTLHGAPSWFELMTTDTARAEQFYTKLFGWTTQVVPLPDGTYTDFKLDGEDVAGMLGVTKEMGMPVGWYTYFTVKKVDDAVTQAQTLGGSIWMPAKDIPAIGRIAGITSPQGVTFYVIAYPA